MKIIGGMTTPARDEFVAKKGAVNDFAVYHVPHGVSKHSLNLVKVSSYNMPVEVRDFIAWIKEEHSNLTYRY